MNSDDPRIPPVDPIVSLRADIDQHNAVAPEIARILAAEHRALVAEGMNADTAAVIVGQRWKAI